MDSQKSLDIQVSGYPSIWIPHPYHVLKVYFKPNRKNWDFLFLPLSSVPVWLKIRYLSLLRNRVAKARHFHPGCNFLILAITLYIAFATLFAILHFNYPKEWHHPSVITYSISSGAGGNEDILKLVVLCNVESVLVHFCNNSVQFFFKGFFDENKMEFVNDTNH